MVTEVEAKVGLISSAYGSTMRRAGNCFAIPVRVKLSVITVELRGTQGGGAPKPQRVTQDQEGGNDQIHPELTDQESSVSVGGDACKLWSPTGHLLRPDASSSPTLCP